MIGIVLCAGEGTRLRPLTLDKPKCMVPFRGKPILQHILQTFESCSLRAPIVVTGYKGNVIDFSGIRKVENPRFQTTNMVTSWFCTEDSWNDDLIISYGDIIYDSEVLRQLIEDPSEFAIVADRDWRKLWSKRMVNPLSDAETFKMDSDGFVRELGKRPKSYDDIEAQYVGLIKIKKSVLWSVRAFYHSLDRKALFDGKNFDSMFMTSFIQLVIDQLLPVKAVLISGGWLEIDSMEDLRALENDSEIQFLKNKEANA